MTTLDSLSARWRAKADIMRKCGAPDQASTMEFCVSELESALREHALEALTLDEARKESGYSYSALQKMVASGELDNVGEKGNPRVRRGDLPRKARTERPGIAHDILARRQGS